MSTAYAKTSSPQPNGLAQTYAPAQALQENSHRSAANDNFHLYIVDDFTHGAQSNHSRSAKLIDDQFTDLTHGKVTWLGTQRLIYASKTIGHKSYNGPNNQSGGLIIDAVGHGSGVYADQPRQLLGDVTGNYTYDGNLKRVKAVTTKDGITKTIYNVYDASGTLVHIDETTDGKTTDYIGKIVRIKTENGTSTPTWLHMDHLGSAETGSDANGLVMWRQQHMPFGETMNYVPVNADLAGYTGHIKDSATGLTYMQARYYDPVIGRFLSIDPVNFTVDQPQMFNRFSYTFNDPVNNLDPDGEACVPCATAGIGAGIGGVVGGISGFFTTGGSFKDKLKGAASGAAGGVVSGGIIGGTGNVVGGLAAGSATSSLVRQKITGDGKINLVETTVDTAVGTVVGKAIPNLKVPGITSGRGSMSHVAATQTTKFATGQVSTISMKTLTKGVTSGVVGGLGQDGASLISGAVQDKVVDVVGEIATKDIATELPVMRIPTD